MKVVNLPAADREFARAVRHYLKTRPSSAASFVDEIDRVAALIAANPYLGHSEGGSARGFVLTGFPYKIIYEIRADTVVVAAFAHHSRRQDYWRTRLPPPESTASRPDE